MIVWRAGGKSYGRVRDVVLSSRAQAPRGPRRELCRVIVWRVRGPPDPSALRSRKLRRARSFTDACSSPTETEAMACDRVARTRASAPERASLAEAESGKFYGRVLEPRADRGASQLVCDLRSVPVGLGRATGPADSTRILSGNRTRRSRRSSNSPNPLDEFRMRVRADLVDRRDLVAENALSCAQRAEGAPDRSSSRFRPPAHAQRSTEPPKTQW